MKERYLDLMERTLSAYSVEHINSYFNKVKTNGLTEHGFPRLTANIGILVSHGRRCDLLPVFLEMMEFCCSMIPRVKAANDFSVREIVCCMREVEKSGIADPAALYRWKNYFASINPYTCYNVIANTPEDKVKNWALFTGVSEFFRQHYGLGNSAEFIDIQLASQFKWIDDNGMYMDAGGDVHHPFVYDLVARGLFASILNDGYRGQYFGTIDEFLKRSALHTLKMQSPNGEIPFGGRSNQFMHNEAWLVGVYEYEANRYAREGNAALASEFKAAIARALDNIEHWLSLEPIRHIKNRFPTETKFGCEGYAYFDKYMITVASNLYAAYLICDGNIPFEEKADTEPCVFETTYHFHKLFAKAGGYGIEFDLNGDQHYDASGLGRVHKAGAPAAICMSLPCPNEPKIVLDAEKCAAMSICPAVMIGDKLYFGAEADVFHNVVDKSCGEDFAYAEIESVFPDGRKVKSQYTVSADGVKIRLVGDGKIACVLPAFDYDGEVNTVIGCDENKLTVSYREHTCTYTSDSGISDLGITAANRSGYYKAYCTEGTSEINVSIVIE